MVNFQLKQIDHALEIVLRRLVTAEGYWPDVEALLAAGATDADLQAAKDVIRNAGRELVEVLGVAPWNARGELKGNNLIVSRLTTGAGSYGTGRPIVTRPVNQADLRQGYQTFRVAAQPQNLRYEVRFVSDDTRMDRIITEWLLATFGQATYLHGLNDDFTETVAGFWVVPVGDSVDLSGDKYTERLWRVEVRDVQLIPERLLENVPAAVDLGLDLDPGAAPVAAAYPLES